ncbi:MAG: FmdB family transcriptional regulator [Acidimicrobiia bacterium]|nr:FmdB family transcriptional regulator [Acidimicrobiia bacterium]MDQ3392437.1 FmdB family transcriptional regulator [Actinomycetota bacterium]
MPIYVYRFVDTGETVEVSQAFTDDTLTEYEHPGSGQVLPVRKVFTPVGVTFKGGGFYKNDSRGGSKRSSSSDSSGSESKGSESKGSDSGSSGSDSSSKSDASKATKTGGSSSSTDSSSAASTSSN